MDVDSCILRVKPDPEAHPHALSNLKLMEAGYYAIERIGTRLPGASGAVEVTILGVAKDDGVERYSLANEYVCGKLASALGLPAPPSTIATTGSGEPMFVSLLFRAGPTSLPAVDPATLIADHPSTAAGIVAFDCWVGNWDRHAGNIAYVRGVSGVSVFDHGRSLLRTPDGQSIDQWRDEVHLPTQNVLAGHVTDLDLLRRWSERIALVASEQIGDACADIRRLKLCTDDESRQVEAFLLHRQTRIMDYLSRGKASLPNVTGWSNP